jgi:hypothetical protein
MRNGRDALLRAAEGMKTDSSSSGNGVLVLKVLKCAFV